MLGTTEIIFIAIIVIILFGGKKIPELMKGLGKGVRIFQQSLKGEHTDVDNEEDSLRGKSFQDSTTSGDEKEGQK